MILASRPTQPFWLLGAALLVATFTVACSAELDWTEAPCTGDEHCPDGYHCDLPLELCAEGSPTATDDGGNANQGLLSGVTLPWGTFEMGCTTGQALGIMPWDCDSDAPAHSVTLTNSFWMSETEVTQGQWQALMGNNPSYFASCGTDCPLEYVNWWEALAFANALSSAEGLAECYTLSECTGTPGNGMECSSVSVNSSTVVDNFDARSVYDCEGYRLPTEAEWEYAARAGTDLLYAGSDTVDEVAWYPGNNDDMTHLVATKLANAWGLYDMSGNAWEWAWDRYDWTFYYLDEWYGTDPEGPTPDNDPFGDTQVFRGGDCDNLSSHPRVGRRGDCLAVFRNRFLGFRLSRTVPFRAREGIISRRR